MSCMHSIQVRVICMVASGHSKSVLYWKGWYVLHAAEQAPSDTYTQRDSQESRMTAGCQSSMDKVNMHT